MASYNLRFNRDDSVIRHILIGLCADLNKKIYLMNQRSQDERVKVDVPFYFSFTGDEDVLYDYFLLDDSLDPDRKKAIGNYDVIPRGIVNVTSFSIDSAALLNKYVRGFYQKEVEGQLKAYTAQFQMIPVVMNCECKVWVDTQLDLFRITEKIIKTLYKNNLYQVDVGHIEDGTYRVPSIYKLSEDYEMERPVEFSFDDEKRKSVNFSIELNSFIPSFENDDEQFAGNRMFEIKQSGEVSINIKKPTIGGPDSIWSKVNK
jgi:hypothetical protein